MLNVVVQTHKNYLNYLPAQFELYDSRIIIALHVINSSICNKFKSILLHRYMR